MSQLALSEVRYMHPLLLFLSLFALTDVLAGAVGELRDWCEVINLERWIGLGQGLL